jgi:D-hydroxyproline dehydrogenase subunit gamma
MMGICFECLVRVDGIDGLQACMIPIRPEMRIETSIAQT